MGNQPNQDQTLHDFKVNVTAKQTDENQELLPEYEKLVAKVHKIKPKASSKGTRANFCFALKAPYEGRYVWGSVPLHDIVTEDANLYKWMTIILGKDVAVGAEVTLGSLVDKVVLVVLKNTVVGEDTYQNVVEVVSASGDVTEAPEEEEPKKAVEEVEPIIENTTADIIEEVNTDDVDLDLPF